MNTAFYTGVSGMIAFQQQLDVTSHNIANSSTPGYKAGRSSFSDLMYTAMDVRTEGDKVTGHGVKNVSTDIVMQQSGLKFTGNALDFAIVGEGFFALQGADGERKYTRNGAFTVSVEGKKGYLVSSTDGSYVLDNRGRRIELETSGADGGSFSAEGLTEKLGVYNFPNPYGLDRANGSSFTETEKSGRAKAVTNTKDNPSYDIKGSTLEFSAVNLGDEMINVIQAQRAFQMNSKIVQTADQIEEMINNLR
ncbi:MAG: flagellar hook-basal body protein [Angelakisella sp.]